MEVFSPSYLTVKCHSDLSVAKSFFWSSRGFWQVTYLFYCYLKQVNCCLYDQGALCQCESREHWMAMRILDHTPGYHKPSPVIMTEGVDHQAGSCPGCRFLKTNFYAALRPTGFVQSKWKKNRGSFWVSIQRVLAHWTPTIKLVLYFFFFSIYSTAANQQKAGVKWTKCLLLFFCCSVQVRFLRLPSCFVFWKQPWIRVPNKINHK